MLEVEGYEWYAGMLVYQGSEGCGVALTPHDPPKQDHKANTVYRGHFTKGFKLTEVTEQFEFFKF